MDPANGSITYVFTLDEGQDNCIESAGINPIVDPVIDPIFSFPLEFCEYDDILILPATSDNGVTGSWVPNIIDPLGNGVGIFTLIFTPNEGECANDLEIEIEILEGVIPLFDPIGDFCTGDPIFILPVISNNGITGSWDIPVIDPSTDGPSIAVVFYGRCKYISLQSTI